MRVVLALLADHASLTNDGKLNVLGIFEAFRPKQMPAVLASLSTIGGSSPGSTSPQEPSCVHTICFPTFT